MQDEPSAESWPWLPAVSMRWLPCSSLPLATNPLSCSFASARQRHEHLSARTFHVQHPHP